MKKTIIGILFLFVSTPILTFASNFLPVLDASIDTNKAFKGADPSGLGGLKERLQTRVISDKKGEGATVLELVSFIAIKILLPIAVLVGLVIAFIGFYKIMTSNKEDDLKKGNQFLIWGTIGVITMVSATFIISKIVGVGADVSGTTGIFGTIGAQGGTLAGQEIAAQIYNTLLFPIIKMLMYIIIGILFISLFISLFKYLFSPAEDIEKKALTIIIRNTIGIITIVLAKYIVEAIFGKYDTVVNQTLGAFNTSANSTAAANLGKIGTPLGDIIVDLDKFFTILNWLLGLLTLIILILIIYQGFKLLFNPTDSGGLATVGKTIGYIFLGILLLGLGYIIANAILPVV